MIAFVLVSLASPLIHCYWYLGAVNWGVGDSSTYEHTLLPVTFLVSFIQFMVAGWSSCHSTEWSTVYSGYLMTLTSGDGPGVSSTEPICVDSSPNTFQKQGQMNGRLKLTALSSGYGFWYKNKAIPCSVCSKWYLYKKLQTQLLSVQTRLESCCSFC